MSRCSLAALLVASLFTLAGGNAHADAPAPVEPGPWKFKTTLGLNLSQSSFSSNWYGGDKGSIVWVVGTSSSAERQFSTRFNSTNTLALSFGQTTRQIPDGASPGKLVWDTPDKTTDQILFESVERFTLGSFADPYAAVRVESQFQDQSNPIGTIPLNPIKVKESAGLARVLEKTEDRETITRLGLGFRQTFGRTFVDAITKEKQSFSSNDGGIEWQTTMTRPIMDKKVLYKGQLLVFQPVFFSNSSALEAFDTEARTADPTREAVADFWKATDIEFQNSFSAQITKSVGVNLFAQFRYDKFDSAAQVDNTQPLPARLAEIDRNIRKAGQFKEVLSLALTYRLF